MDSASNTRCPSTVETSTPTMGRMPAVPAASRPRTRRKNRSWRAGGRRNSWSIRRPDEKPSFAVLPCQVDHGAVGEQHPEQLPVRRPLLVPPRPDLPPAAEDLDDAPLPAAPPSARRPGDPHASVTVLY